jgi:hypothetical protein
MLFFDQLLRTIRVYSRTVSVGTVRLSLIAGALLAGPAVGPAAAADLIEPWESGFSNLELHYAVTARSRSRTVTSLAGFGVADGVSLGTWICQVDAEESHLGFVGILTRPLSRRMEIDLWGQISVVDTLHPDARGRETGWDAGAEWSLALQQVVPYARFSHASSMEGGRWRGLAGFMLTAGPRLELHLEGAAEEPRAGARLTSVALGPNLRIHPRVELLPEIAYVDDRAAGETTWVATIGVVIDPRQRRAGG